MNYLNSKFELVRNEGSTKENVLCKSADRIKLIELKNELIKLHNRNRYIVRPEVRKINLN